MCLVFILSDSFTWQFKNMEKLSPNRVQIIYSFYYGWHCSSPVPYPNCLWSKSYRPVGNHQLNIVMYLKPFLGRTLCICVNLPPNKVHESKHCVGHYGMHRKLSQILFCWLSSPQPFPFSFRCQCSENKKRLKSYKFLANKSSIDI